MNTYLGMDFGGTKLLIGETDETGALLRCRRYSTGCTKQKDAVEVLLKALRDYRDNVGYVGTLQAAGVGIVGIVDHQKGNWISMAHEPEGQPVPLAQLVERELGIPCGIDNDVRSATIAELLLGQGRYSQNFIYLNGGTGLAAGFVVDGCLLRGANVNAGEIGHMVVDLSDVSPCVCGRRGCVENVVSGIGFTQQARRYGLDWLFRENHGCVDVPRLFIEAERGNAACREIVMRGARELACVIMNLVRVTDPDTIIYGGSILGDKKFLRLVEENLDAGTMRGVTRGLLASSFDPQYAGLLGAASLGMVKSKALRLVEEESA